MNERKTLEMKYNIQAGIELRWTVAAKPHKIEYSPINSRRNEYRLQSK